MVTWNKVNKASGTSWTKVPKASGGASVTTNPGNPIGLLLALTYATTNTANVGIWTPITKASGTNWTKISKAV